MFVKTIFLYTNRTLYNSKLIRKITNVQTDNINPNEIQKVQSDDIQNNSVLEPNENLSLETFAPNLRPTFNFAAYINKSYSLQQLVKLGVDLSKIERRKGLPEFILKLDFERDMKPHITFLHDIGIAPDSLSTFITKNPLIFKESLEDLKVRLNYLESKKFKPEDVQFIVKNNPFWLMFSTTRIDKRLGYFQKQFRLSGDQTRALAVQQPRLITYNLEHIIQNTFTVKEEMGFSDDEIKELLLSKPKIWMINKDHLINRFEYAHLTMKLTHEQIIKMPEVLMCREFRMKQRHEFLEYIGRAQYDPKKDLYISPKTIVEGTDSEFVTDIAKSSMDKYETFLKSK